MDSQHKVLFYGNSLMLAGLKASLTVHPGLEVTALDTSATETELLACNPNVIIFDMGAFQSEFTLSQMQALPGLLLIGVDAESHEVLLTGQAACLISLDQITHIVRDWARPGVINPVSPSTKGT
jgi:hypothetical protein